MRFRDRADAGRQLVAALEEAGFATTPASPVVLGVARGGIEVAAPIAAAFDAPLGVVIARKLGAPRNPELAIGAVGSTGDAFIDEWLVRRLRVSDDYVASEVDRQRAEVRRRAAQYGTATSADPAGCDVAVVDDGVATGATLIAALRSVRAAQPARLVCAVPVGPPDTLRKLEVEADLVVCPLRPPAFAAVGEWYGDFSQTDDATVVELLAAAAGTD